MNEADLVLRQQRMMETVKKKATHYKGQPVTTMQEQETIVATMFNFSRDDRTLVIACEMYQYLNVGK